MIHENKRIIKNKLVLSQYEILKESYNHAIENFHVLYKGESMNKEALHNFVLKFRKEYTTKNTNIYVYNKSDIANLIDKYPLNDKEAELLLSCTIAESWFTNPTKSMLIYLESVAVIKVIIIRYNILLFWVHL